MEYIEKALEDEFVEQFTSDHGGDYDVDILRVYFRDGFKGLPFDGGGYHYFLAWAAGAKHRGVRQQKRDASQRPSFPLNP